MRVLFITFHFPPSAEVGGKRIARFCRHLPRFGIEPVVLTVEARFAERLDTTFPVPDDLRIVRTPVWQMPLDWYGRLIRARATHTQSETQPATTGEGNVPAARKGLRRHVVAALRFPDRRNGWYFPAVRAGSRLLSSEHFDAIISSGPPHSLHLIGRRLSLRHRIPWIADFRDAWTADSWRRFDTLPRWRDRT